MNSLRIKKKELREHLPPNGIKSTIRLLKDFLVEDSEKVNTLILIESQIEDVRKKQARGIIDFETVSLEENKCRNYIIDLIDDIKWEDTTLSLFTDPRDHKRYKTINIGGQIWMAENFAFENTKGVSFYENNPKYKKYGCLYSQEAANKSCPTGWRLPTDEDWMNLAGNYGEFVNPEESAININTMLIISRDSLFSTIAFLSGNRLNKYSHCFNALTEDGYSGFNALLAGEYSKDEQFNNLGTIGSYWGYSKNNKYWGFTFRIDNRLKLSYCNNELNKYSRVSVRYVLI